MRFYWIAISIIAVASALWAQSEGGSGDTVASVQLPSSVNANILPAATVPETQRNRQWGTRITAVTTCDNNVRATPTNVLSDCSLALQPSLLYQQNGSRTTWNLSYTPSFSLYRRYTSLNEMDQAVGLDAEHRFTRRLSVRVREAFLKTTNLMSGVPANTDLPSFGLMQRANDFLITPLARQISTTTGLDTTYVLSAASFVGMSATYSDQQYDNVNGISSGLQRTRAGTVSLIYSRRLGSRQWLGASYLFEHLRIGFTEWTGIHSLLYTDTIVVSPRLSISGFVGPQYSRDHLEATAFVETCSSCTLPSLVSRWSMVGGASIEWAGRYNRLDGSFVHRISDSNGLFGTSVISTVAGGFTHKLSPRLSGTLGGSYGTTTALDNSLVFASMQANTAAELRSTSLDVAVDYAFRPNLSFGAFYVRDWQDDLGAPVIARIERDRLALSLTYNFVRPLWR